MRADGRCSTGRRSGSPGPGRGRRRRRCGGETWAMPGSRRAVGRDRRRPRRSGAAIWSAPGAPGPKAAGSAVADAGAVALGTTLIEGMPVFSPRTGRASSDERRAPRPGRTGAGGARAARPSGRSAASGARPSAPRGATSASTFGPSFASTAGSRVSVAARTKTTLIMIPSAIERNAGLGTSITAESETSTVSAGEQDGLAGGVHRHRDRVAGPSRDPKKAPRKRWTMKSA